MTESKPKRKQAYLRSRLYLIAAFCLTALFILLFVRLAANLEKNELEAFDQTVIGWISAWQTPGITAIMRVLTFLGSTRALAALVLIGGILMLFAKKRWEALFFVLSVGGSGLFNTLLKHLFRRERPTLHRLIEETGYSFPSGHSMGSMAAYGMLAVLLILFLKNRIAKLAIAGAGALLILFIGISRIYLGVHYPSDVAAGFAAGAAWLTICIVALQSIRNARRAAAKPA